jgi:uncharacterized protein
VYCNHELSNYVVIGPDLSQIACSFVMNKIGQISGNGSADVDLHKYVNWQSKDPFNDKECRQCKLLPLCLGGCNYKWVVTKKKSCIDIKYNMEDWIRLLYKNQVRQKQRNELSVNSISDSPR